MLTRAELIRAYPCPRCAAPAGTACGAGRRKPQHAQRWAAAGISQGDLHIWYLSRRSLAPGNATPKD